MTQDFEFECTRKSSFIKQMYIKPGYYKDVEGVLSSCKIDFLPCNYCSFFLEQLPAHSRSMVAFLHTETFKLSNKRGVLVFLAKINSILKFAT